jgi:hypothetical protein
VTNPVVVVAPGAVTGAVVVGNGAVVVVTGAVVVVTGAVVVVTGAVVVVTGAVVVVTGAVVVVTGAVVVVVGEVVVVVGAVVVVVGAVVVVVGTVVVVGAVVVVVVGTVVVGGVLQPGARVNALVSSDTWPLRARARPSTVTPVVTVIDVRAMIVPLNTDPVPSVAELPTCQKTLQASARLIRLTLLAEAVNRAEVTWKMKTALGSPWPSNVRVPLSASVLVEL